MGRNNTYTSIQDKESIFKDTIYFLNTINKLGGLIGKRE